MHDVDTAETARRKARVEATISRLLRAGVVISLALVLVGTALTFLGHHDYVTSTRSVGHLTKPPASFPRTVGRMLDGVAGGDGPAVVVLGLLVLIVTPVVRVAVSLLIFAIEGDGPYVAITLFVLVVILVSFAIGKASG